jgi:hypothetical protein
MLVFTGMTKVQERKRPGGEAEVLAPSGVSQ